VVDRFVRRTSLREKLAVATASSLMTVEELLAMPDDGIERELIRGELREHPMSLRSAPHCLVTSNLDYLLGAWLRQQPRPRGRLFAGDVRVRVQRDPNTFVGIDLAYIAADLATRTAADALYIDGIPALAIEIFSPSDTVLEIAKRTESYLEAGVPLVWEVNPFSKTVSVYRPGQPPELFNVTHELTAEPHPPGLRIPVAEIFAR
jgi:Uma2 family endonuclease